MSAMEKPITIDRYCWTTGRDAATAKRMLQAERRRVRALVRTHYPQYDATSEDRAVSATLTRILAALKEGR